MWYHFPDYVFSTLLHILLLLTLLCVCYIHFSHLSLQELEGETHRRTRLIGLLPLPPAQLVFSNISSLDYVPSPPLWQQQWARFSCIS